MPVAGVVLVCAELWGNKNLFVPGFLLYDTVLALFFGWLVSRSARGFSGLPGRILQFGPVSYIGKISYGIYVYHPLVTDALRWSVAKTPLEHLNKGWLGLCIATVFALGASSLSWFALEKPLNDLKRHFEDH
ncbi:MAG: acyltransferase [Acidobacteria bacterium]|nr:acyltransferase [Acidobacteriota bacterium]